MKWEENVRKVVPYVPGEQPKMQNLIKLNTNEFPYPPAPAVQKAIAEFDYDKLRLYSDPCITDLTAAVADLYGLKPENAFVGIGSDDVLAMAFLTFFNSGKKILFPDITYSFYDVWADLYRIPYEMQPLMEDFSIRKEDYFKENGGVILANMPTFETVEKYCAENHPNVNAQDFYDYYKNQGWCCNGKPIKNWRSLLKSWANHQRDDGETTERSYDIDEFVRLAMSRPFDEGG